MTLKNQPERQALFKGYVFALVLDTSDYETKKTLRKKITSNGGTISYLITNKCHFVIRCQSIGNTLDWGLGTAQKYGITIVTPQFIDDCLAEGKVVAPTTCQDELRAQMVQHLEEQFQKGQITANGGPTSESRQQAQKTKMSSVTKSLKIWEFDDVNAPQFHDRTYKVAKFTILKGEVRLKGDVPFCVLEIHISECDQPQESSSGQPRYCVFADVGFMVGNKDRMLKYSWGTKAGARTCRYTDDRNFALQTYCQLYRTYTFPPHSMSKWDRHHTIPSFIGSPEFQKIQESWTISTSQLDERVQELVDNIWMEAETRLEEILATKTVDISCHDADRAESILLQIHRLLDDDKSQSKKDVEDLSRQYLSIIHQKEKQDLSSKDVLARQRKFLQLVRDMARVSEAIPGDGDESCSMQVKYKALGCWIRYLEEDSEEFLTAKNQVMSSLNEDSKTLEIKNIFAVRRPAENTSFAGHISNHQMLFHGSDVYNYVGILSRGLLLDETNERGEAATKLGRAVYFSHSASTSASYSLASKGKGTRLMSMVDVALGNSYSTQKRMPQLTAPPAGYDSVRGIPSPDPLASDFQESEFAIFHVNQQKLTHLVEFVLPGDTPLSTHFGLKAQISQSPKCDSKDTEATVTQTLKAHDALDEFMSTKEGKPIQWGLQSTTTEMIPLKSLHVRARLIDLSAKVVIMQEYVNTSKQNIEAKYVFPLEELAAVCAFEAFIDDKHVVGVIEEKQQAHKQYRRAIQKGHGAYLMDEEAPEVFAVNIGNLPAKAVVIIKITYVAELTTENEKIRFGLPGSLVPLQKTVSHGPQENMNVVDGLSPEHLSLHIGIEMPFLIRAISSPTNRILVKKTDTMATVKLRNGETIDKGFELLIDVAEIHVPRMWVEKHDNEDSAACMLTFYPSFCNQTIESGTVILLLDASNSMKQDSFPLVQKIALLSLRRLNPEWKFNVVLFGSICEELFLVPQPKTAENISSAEDFIMGAKATLGCTLPLVALHTFFLLQPRDDDDTQNIFLISDGHMTNADPLLLEATKHKSTTRILTFGVGSKSNPCNQHMLKILAKKAAEAFEYFDSRLKSKWEAKISRQLHRASQPVLTDIQIHWQQLDNDATPPIQAPSKLLSLFHGERQVIYGFVPHCTMATLKARVGGHELSTVVSTSELSKTKGTMLHSLTARAIIRDWSDGILEDDGVHHEAKKLHLTSYIISLSKRYGILSSLTSYIAIEKRDKVGRNSAKGASIQELLDGENIDHLSYIEFEEEELGVRGKRPLETQTLQTDSLVDLGKQMMKRQRVRVQRQGVMLRDLFRAELSSTEDSSDCDDDMHDDMMVTFCDDDDDINDMDNRIDQFTTSASAKATKYGTNRPFRAELSSTEDSCSSGEKTVHYLPMSPTVGDSLPLGGKEKLEKPDFEFKHVRRHLVTLSRSFNNNRPHRRLFSNSPTDSDLRDLADFYGPTAQSSSFSHPTLFGSGPAPPLENMIFLDQASERLQSEFHQFGRSRDRGMGTAPGPPPLFNILSASVNSFASHEPTSGHPMPGTSDKEKDVPFIHTTNAMGGLPACSALLHQLIHSAKEPFNKCEFKALLKQGPGPRQSELHSFQEKLSNLATSEMDPCQTDAQAQNIWWKHQEQDGLFAMANAQRWTNASITTQMTQLLDENGLKSIGTDREHVLNMCATLAAVFTQWKAVLLAYPDVNDSSALEKSAAKLVSFPFPKWQLFGLLTALIYIFWVHDHHPLLYTTLQLSSSGLGSTWESFILRCLQTNDHTLNTDNSTMINN